MIRETTKRLGVLAAIGLISAPAAAQVTTPPPKPTESGEAYTPPPKRAPVRATPGGNSNRGQVDRAPVPRHDPLAEVGEDGYIVRLDRLSDEVALERNPFIGGTKNQGINELRIERLARMERQVIENIDLLIELDKGLVEEIRLADIDGMQRVAQMIQPLIADPSLSHELKERGMLTRIQSEATNGIVRQYQSAINAELKERYPDEHLDHFMRFIMTESIKEARLAHTSLLEEGAGKIADLQSNLSGGASDAIQGVTSAEQLRTALAGLPLEDHQAALRAIIALRDDPTLPPLKPIDFGTGKTTQNTGEAQVERNEDGSVKFRGGEVIKEGEKPNDG